MPTTIARIKKASKHFEVIVDLEEALKFKRGESDSFEIEGDRIFTDHKKGLVPSQEDLKNAFGTTDVGEIAKRIVKEGEVLLTQEYRSEEREKKFKQAVDFLVRNAVDPQTGNPHTAERIKNALEQSGINLKNAPIESQIKEIIEAVSKILPIKIKTKKVKVIIPPIHVGRAYGLVSQYKEQEEWKDDGSLEVVLNIPQGHLMDFYEKLNSMTKGSAIAEELKEE